MFILFLQKKYLFYNIVDMDWGYIVHCYTLCRVTINCKL